MTAGLLILGALPSAMVTASSIVTPITAVFILAIGAMATTDRRWVLAGEETTHTG